MTDQGQPLLYARTVLLPIWERWAGGDLSMRYALDCESADPHTHFEVRTRAVGSVTRLMLLASQQPSMRAAINAGVAIVAALGGEPLLEISTAARIAEKADTEARRDLPRA